MWRRFDYSLAFDFANPALAVEILRWLGMPAGTAGLLKSVWQSQKRTIQYAGESLKTAEPVMTSLPQGDPWSMIAMAAVLLIPLCDLRKRYPTRTSCCTSTTDHGRRNRRRTA